ncbi:bifunctional proline dehydrogenase/L-glutamate gamma-semialdehyde dehydrogenase PutA [Photobacterium sp. ZSDE20]|uniref:Bifunctional protein PutA n=1 Tax=Photobacterium pectinilyticum TaxID=2906793 RepID=A0ABT1N3L9_9GAMM|nr:bifunctional proline dehydrogenase/L-glutamate gamma-semialdehyde dehydrogenase PutA [Photobacterium sp. ZSDE20]MCQ1059328.1 bifunctional proline dehydrogenase/L-glutamate gamma-semialdehyde dehydrogenase PutA [Photobacterium sp. ZSDE20]MDD1825587.1 bifunctional proline dehydrogenase/L-glutamate gamma-semialdehyde dehydrogenase PutA [Photobacterium sp. ZSDE20]
MLKKIELLGPDITKQSIDELEALTSSLYMVDETKILQELLPLATPSKAEKAEMELQANELILAIRADKKSIQMIDALLLEYSLDTQEGILLMCLAEALMRIPDAATADALIRDKLTVADWKSHLKGKNSVFVNASTWGLMLTGKVCGIESTEPTSPTNAISKLVTKLSEPVIRQVMNQAMAIIGRQFVLGRNIREAQKNGRPQKVMGYDFSFDMLGEAALTKKDAQKYFNDYMSAIEIIGADKNQNSATIPSISMKLSALHPRYNVANEDRVMTELFTSVLALAKRARELNVPLTIDAEEMDRLELSLRLFKKLYRHPVIKGWGKFGLVVQTYAKRALPVFAWLNRLAEEQGDMIPVRLVKGAYWDSEIKLAQQGGYENYPVFTRKEGTDVSYLACARYVLSKDVNRNLYPQFASHNAQTVTAIAVMGKESYYEFQRLHGMGEALYNHVMKKYGANVRIYAPVGSHKDLLPYLVRRLLENGANSSFVHRLVDASCPPELLTQHPVEQLLNMSTLDNKAISLPPAIFPDRPNSAGINVDIDSEREPFEAEVNAFMDMAWTAAPVINGKSLYSELKESGGVQHKVTAPYDSSVTVGDVIFGDREHVEQAIESSHQAWPLWRETPIATRGNCLNTLADLLESNMAELVALCHKEAGKTIHDAIDEIREAVDFCRYYARQDQVFISQKTRSFDGEPVSFSRQGRGVFVCISPWNFPLAIFLGQVTAALMAGNTVVCKPAQQTSLIAARAASLMKEAGFPDGVFQLVPGTGSEVGHYLTSHPLVAGVAFTGSTQTAMRINQTLAGRQGEPVPFIAETGGQNTMIVDSTALPEQVVRDVLRSAFASAGQRCSALRVLCIQEDIADHIIELISGAMDELVVGLPYLHKTDVGPVIDTAAKEKLGRHINQMKRTQRLIKEVELDACCDNGMFIAPIAFEIAGLSVLEEENFGPILHIVRFNARELPQLVDDINATGYGLTLGIHSRNETTYRWIEKQTKVGNSYINRDQVGAVVGVQPFGGQGLSGTGPKAGGPHYLYRFTQVKYDDTPASHI